MKIKYEWNCEPVQKVEFGYCDIISPDETRNLYWYNYEYHTGSTRVAAIRITVDEYSFVISNHHGIGYKKISNGGHSGLSHYSLPLEWFTPDGLWEINKFDRAEYLLHEAKRSAWQAERYPEEHRKLVAIRQAFSKGTIKFGP